MGSKDLLIKLLEVCRSIVLKKTAVSSRLKHYESYPYNFLFRQSNSIPNRISHASLEGKIIVPDE